MFEIILKKELRSGRITDYIVFLLVFVITVFSKSFVFMPFMVLFLSDRFLNPIWNRNEEFFFYYFIANKSFKDVILINKILLLFESNLLFITISLLLKGVNVFADLICFNSFLFLFLGVSDFLCLKSFGANYKHQKNIRLTLLALIAILYSSFILIIEYQKKYFLTLSIICLMSMIYLNFLSINYLLRSVNLNNNKR